MSTKTPESPDEQENDQHGGAANQPRFGGRGDWSDNPADNQPSGNPTDPRENDIAAGDSSDPRSTGTNAEKTASPSQINNAENQGGTADKGKVDNKESGAANKLGKGFTGGAGDAAATAAGAATGGVGGAAIKAGQMAGRILGGKKGFNRKKGATAGIVTLLIGGIISLFAIGQGPLQLIHLGEILRKSTFNSDKDRGVRASAIIRYWQSGDIGQTRLSFYGAKVAKGAVQKLSNQGVKPIDRSARGRPRAFEIDTNRNDATKNIPNREAQIRAYSAANGIPIESIKSVGDHSIRIETPPGRQGIDLTNKIISGGLAAEGSGSLVDGKIHTAEQQRILKRLFGLPRLFSAWEKKADIKERIVQSLQSKEQKIKERNNARKGRAIDYKGPTARKIDNAKEKFRNKPNVGQTLGRGLILQSGLCIARSVAGSVAIANRAAVVAPAVIEQNHILTTAAQTKSGNNFFIGQVELETDGLYDEDGGSVWQSKPLNALAKNGKGGTGKEINNDYKQAFANNNVEKEMKDKFSIKVGPVNLSALVCSKVAQAAGLIAGFGATLASCSTVVGCGLAVGKFTSSNLVAAQVLALFSDQLVGWLANEQIDWESLPGDQRGALLAYASRESANINARQSGGSMLSETEEKTILAEAEAADKEEFQGKPFFARLFDIYDYRSLASQNLLQLNLISAQNIPRLTSGLANIGNFGSGIFSSFLPSAYAQQEESYAWGFPVYGIPSKVFDDPEFENPYQNAEDVAVMLGDNDDHPYIERSKKCFGVNLTKDSEGRWQVETNEEEGDVNPQSEDYHNANCNEDKKEWRQVQMFVFDSRLMTSMACYEEEEEACAELGVETGSSSEVSDSGGGGSEEVSGDAKELAQKILDNKNIDISSSNFCRHCTEDIKNTADGKPAYGNVSLNVKLLQFLADLGQETKVDVNSITGEGSGHTDGSNHYNGTAIDFGCNGISGSVLDRVGKKYGVKSNFERCDAGVDHWHYSTSGK